MGKIIAIAKEKHLMISEVHKSKLDELTDGQNHQGVAAETTSYEYCEIDDILSVASQSAEQPFIIIFCLYKTTSQFGN